jgi:sporulation-control protein spo0M
MHLGKSDHQPAKLAIQSQPLTFGMDMIFRQHARTNWKMLKLQHCRQAIANHDKENQTCITHNYKVGEKVLIVQKTYKRTTMAKLSSPTEGPFTIVQVDMNGNVLISCNAYDEDISIRRLHPYYELPVLWFQRLSIWSTQISSQQPLSACPLI